MRAPLAEDHAHAGVGPEHDVAADRTDLAGLGELEMRLAQEGRQHQLELVGRERGADAATVSAAEGRKFEGREAALEEALRTEPVGVGVERLVAVQQRGGHVDAERRGELVAGDLERAGEQAGHVGHDRVQAQGLVADRVEEREPGDRVGLRLVAERVDLGAQALERGRVAVQPIEGPREGDAGGLVAGEQEGLQLVAQLDVAHAGPALVAGREQHGQDVFAVRLRVRCAGRRSPRR
jgi:hypothetical protein